MICQLLMVSSALRFRFMLGSENWNEIINYTIPKSQIEYFFTANGIFIKRVRLEIWTKTSVLWQFQIYSRDDNLKIEYDQIRYVNV
jgi:hypothetical protein